MVEAAPFPAAGAVAGADNTTSHPLTANAAKAMIRATPILLTGRDMTAPFLPDPLAPWREPYVSGAGPLGGRNSVRAQLIWRPSKSRQMTPS